MVWTKSLLDTVSNILLICKKKHCSDNELQELISMLSENPNTPILGRICGYSISDYAFSALYLIDNENAKSVFKQEFYRLSKDRQSQIKELIRKKYYLDLE